MWEGEGANDVGGEGGNGWEGGFRPLGYVPVGFIPVGFCPLIGSVRR